MADQYPGEHLILKSNTLVFYVDESGDERLNNPQHPIFAFGGVACPSDFHLPIARAWQAMKAEHFPQVDGQLQRILIFESGFHRRSVLPYSLAWLIRNWRGSER